MNKDKIEKIKNDLTIDQIEHFLEEHGGNPKVHGDTIISRTICHNAPGEGSHKLYYYDNTHLFRCYTDCGDGAFDIFQLTLKIKQLAGITILTKNNTWRQWSLPDSISYVANFFNIEIEEEKNVDGIENNLLDWKFFLKLETNKLIKDKNSPPIKLKIYNGDFLKNLPRPRIVPWINEGITQDIIKKHNICYDPINGGVVIPHYDINNNLIGIRERTFVSENIDNGKYKPAFLNGKMYNHPLSFSLYNLNLSKENISKIKKVIIFESEKSTLLYGSYFGLENDISVAVCGSNLINYQFQLLMNLGVTEIIIGFDRQYKESNKNDREWILWTKKLNAIHQKYGAYVQISYLFDKEHYLEYKMSPIDNGKDIFLYLFQNRIVI